MEVELMVTKRDDDDDRRQGEYRAICLWKMDWQSFAISVFLSMLHSLPLHCVQFVLLECPTCGEHTLH